MTSNRSPQRLWPYILESKVANIGIPRYAPACWCLYSSKLHSLVCLVPLILLSLPSVHLRGPAMTNTCLSNMYGSWTRGCHSTFYTHATLAGGHLQGVLDILDHLVDLGIRGHPKGERTWEPIEKWEWWMLEPNGLFTERWCSNIFLLENLIFIK